MRHIPPSALTLLCPQGYFRDIGRDGLIGKREFIEAPEVIPLFNIVIYSEEDHPHAMQLAKVWKQIAPDTNFIITRGPEGADIVEKDEILHVPTTPLLPEEIIDSVGCGDVFAITTAYQYRVSNDLNQAVQKAHLSAAQKLRGTPLK